VRMAKRVRGPPVSASPPLAVDTGKKETNQQEEESHHCHFHLFGREEVGGTFWLGSARVCRGKVEWSKICENLQQYEGILGKGLGLD